MNEESQNRNSIKESLRILNDVHSETLKALAESEKKDLEFELQLAEIVWERVKGYPIPDSYSVQDRLDIISRYWTRAMDKEF